MQGIAEMPVEEVFAMYAEWTVAPENLSQQNEAVQVYHRRVGSTAITASVYVDRTTVSIVDLRHHAVLQITENRDRGTYSVIMPESPEAFKRSFGTLEA